MSTDFAIRPVGTPPHAPPPRPTPEATQKPVQTELPQAQSVTAADNAATSRNDAIAARDRLARQFVFDRDAAQMVYQVVDNTTESVVGQVPDEAVIRRRAYLRQLDQANPPARRIRTDRTA